jgi:protein-S-isoprenylcysteine O-methyltransferase Ste14
MPSSSGPPADHLQSPLRRRLTDPRLSAAVGSLLFLVVAPGVVAGLVPWALTGWESAGPPLVVAVVGSVFLVAGVVVLLHAFVRFVVEGVGTPAPVAPTQHLVVGGLYRYVRNPMYIAVAATILGQAMVLGRPVLLLYALVFGVAVGSFVHLYEEPTLTAQFGAEYEAYREAVPAWLPRRRPWRPDRPTDRSDDAAP